MRVAFLIMNHRDPAQLTRLVTTLRLELPEAPIIVHNDKFRADIAAAAMDSIENAYLLTSDEPIYWADFTLVTAFWRSLAWMIEHVEFDWVILLSAQDYPIKSLAGLGGYLAATGVDALLNATPIGQLGTREDRRNRRRRYLYQYRPAGWSPGRHTELLTDIFNNVQPYVHIYKLSDRMPGRVGFRARSTPFTESQPCWFGSVWISLSRRAAQFVVTAARERSGYVEYYRRTIHPDESATATLIYNSSELRIEPHDIHHVRWTHSRTGHPDVFVATDLPELLAAPAYQYFARKFDIAKDARILDELDHMLASARAAEHRPRREESA